MTTVTAEKTIIMEYFALLREERGCSREEYTTQAETTAQLYAELRERYGFTLDTNLLRVAVNSIFATWETHINPGDTVVFIPPVAGG
jgi:molybdopterin converting factor small subunit